MGFGMIWNTIIFPLVFAAIGAVMVFIGLRNRRRAEASQSWFPAAGVVKVANLKKHYRKGGVDYEPKVEYTYTIMGTPYEGKRLCFGTPRLTYKKATEKLSLYPPGGKIVAYYNPDKPTEAVLEREAPGVGGILFGGILLLLFGIGLAVFPYIAKYF